MSVLAPNTDRRDCIPQDWRCPHCDGWGFSGFSGLRSCVTCDRSGINALAVYRSLDEQHESDHAPLEEARR